MADDLRNSLSYWMQRDSGNDKVDSLEAALNNLADQGKQNTLTYKLLLAQYNREYRKTSEDFNREFGKHTQKFTNSFKDITNKFVNNITKSVDSYVSKIEKIAYGLNGTARGYSGVTANLNKILNGQNIVTHEAAYNNFAKLLENGIVSNAEQNAFLQTLSEDLGMEFRVTTDTMRQLIKIQGTDSTANRMAIEYSLREFLVQNYQTGEYIKQGFSQVSKALLESQALMTSSVAASYEATIQTWMGSLYSNGVSTETVNSLAQAII